MTRYLVIFIAQVKYPSSNSTYLTANSYLVEKDYVKDVRKFTEHFKSYVEKDGFKIINFLVYVVPKEQLE